MPVRPESVDLDEGPGQLLALPGSAGLAGTKANRDVLDAHCLARAEGQVANNAVALVEQAKHRDSLGHRRDPGLLGGSTRHVDRGWLVGDLVILLGALAAASGKQQGDRQKCLPNAHAWSGFHAS